MRKKQTNYRYIISFQRQHECDYSDDSECSYDVKIRRAYNGFLFPLACVEGSYRERERGS